MPVSQPPPPVDNLPRFLGYAFSNGAGARYPGKGFKIDFHPLAASASFLGFAGVVMFAGAYEQQKDVDYLHGTTQVVCRDGADLDRREKEFFTALDREIPFVFLIPRMIETLPGQKEDQCDLFRRVLRRMGIKWYACHDPNPRTKSDLPEFREFVERFGTGYVGFARDKRWGNSVKPLCIADRECFGLVIDRRVFLLPCITNGPRYEMAKLAIEAVIAYRERTATELPEWVTTSFVFDREAALRRQAEDLRAQLNALEAQISGYGEYKAALCCQSDPLVQIVCRILDQFCGMQVVVDERYIDDGTLRDTAGTIKAVIEIKGVKGNFTRNNVNQIDSHRERLELPPSTPGVLIMNTCMAASSLKEKNERPHPDIIEKAAKDHVLLIRTLDLLRFADGVERGSLAKDDLRRIMMTECGWLHVHGDEYEVVKG